MYGLKAQTCSKHGKMLVDLLSHIMPFQETVRNFFCISDNKFELFSFIKVELHPLQLTQAQKYLKLMLKLCTPSWDTSGLALRTHNKADTCIFLHLEVAMKVLKML